MQPCSWFGADIPEPLCTKAATVLQGYAVRGLPDDNDQRLGIRALCDEHHAAWLAHIKECGDCQTLFALTGMETI